MREFEGYIRNPSVDQPRLVSQCIGQEDRAIPAQIGFTAPNGTDVQIPYQRAVDLGLIEPTVIPTERIDIYGKKKL